MNNDVLSSSEFATAVVLPSSFSVLTASSSVVYVTSVIVASSCWSFVGLPNRTSASTNRLGFF